MGIVIVTADGLEHRYVANALTAQFEIDAILICDPALPRSWKSILLKDPFTFLDKLGRKAFLMLIGDRAARARSIAKVLGPQAERFDRPKLVRRVGRAKAGALASVVAELAPDILVIYGTSIIPDDILRLPKRVALNMHTGLSPDYRGVSCAFWPISDGRPDMVGATVHECTPEVDGGQIYFRKAATLQVGDDLHAIFARAVLVGAQGYVETVRDFLAGDPEGKVQDLSQGREFRGNQIGLRSEIATRLGLRKLRRQNLL